MMKNVYKMRLAESSMFQLQKMHSKYPSNETVQREQSWLMILHEAWVLAECNATLFALKTCLNWVTLWSFAVGFLALNTLLFPSFASDGLVNNANSSFSRAQAWSLSLRETVDQFFCECHSKL